jgi:hypothetical protein
MKTISILFSISVFLSCNKIYDITKGQNFTTSSEMYNFQARTLFDYDIMHGAWNNGRVSSDTLSVDFIRPFKISSISFRLSSLPISTFNIKLKLLKNDLKMIEVDSNVIVKSGDGNSFFFNNFSNNSITKLQVILESKKSYIMMSDLKILGK